MRVTIEIIPHGIEKRKRAIARAVIANDGTGNESMGNYKVMLSSCGNPKMPWRASTVQGFDRIKLNAWHLLSRALMACNVREENDVD